MPRKPESKISNVFLFLTSLLLVTYSFECFLQYQKRSQQTFSKAELAEQAGLTYDTRSKFDVVMDERNSGLDSYPAFFGVSPVTLGEKTFTPLFAGVPRKRTVYCNESGQYFIYQSDEEGFNNPEKSWVGQLSVALVGDSFVQGACLNSQKDLGWHIRKKQPKLIALGRGGGGPLYSLALIKEYLLEKKPQDVFWFYFYNDLENLEQEKEKARGLLPYLAVPSHNQDLSKHREKISRLVVERLHRSFKTTASNTRGVADEKPDEDYIKNIATLSEITLLLKKLSSELLYPPDFETYALALEEAKRTVSGWNGTLHFVYLPSWSEVTTPSFFEKRNRAKVLEIVSRLNIPLIDLHPLFSAHEDPPSLFPFRQHGHYTAEGYQIAGEQIVKYLETRAE